MDYRISVLVRDFQAGAGRIENDGTVKEFDLKGFASKSKKVVNLLQNTQLIDHVTIISSRDVTVPWGEATDDSGATLTWQAYQEHYPELVKSSRLRVVFVDDWGKNAGSGRAVQAGIDNSLAAGYEHIMVWSPELEVDSTRVAQAMGFLKHYNLDGIGFLREHYYTKPQWMLPQHTGLIATRHCWELTQIPAYVDGDEGLTVDTPAGPAALAGMDDMARIFEALRVYSTLRFGMYGWSNPIPWNINPEDRRQVEKIARQWAVTVGWAKRSFPDQDPIAVIARFIASLKMI